MGQKWYITCINAGWLHSLLANVSPLLVSKLIFKAPPLLLPVLSPHMSQQWWRSQRKLSISPTDAANKADVSHSHESPWAQLMMFTESQYDTATARLMACRAVWAGLADPENLLMNSVKDFLSSKICATCCLFDMWCRFSPPGGGAELSNPQ